MANRAARHLAESAAHVAQKAISATATSAKTGRATLHKEEEDSPGAEEEAGIRAGDKTNLARIKTSPLPLRPTQR